jgi:hypothetical protein
MSKKSLSASCHRLHFIFIQHDEKKPSTNSERDMGQVEGCLKARGEFLPTQDAPDKTPILLY